MAAAGKTLNDVVEELQSINSLIDDAASEQKQLAINQISLLESFNVTSVSTLNVLGNILSLMLDDSAAAREAAREAARAAKGAGGEKDKVPDAKVEEAKAGGFFSKLGMAVMNPMKALGSGLAKIGRGIEGLLTGIARGIMAFANPLVIIGVATLSISLPIFAAGLAAAFKVFDMILGQGSALELITGIIESLGKAIGTILHDVLVGFGKMIKFAGPGIKLFFDGLANVIKALAPIVTSFFKVIKDIITDPVLNKTIQAVLKVIESAIKSVEKVLIAFAPYIEGIMKVLGDVVVKVFGIIKDIITDPVLNKTIVQLLKTVEVVIKEVGKAIKVVGDVIIAVVENIGGVIESIGKAISNVITAIGDTISNVITAIGDSVTKVINSIGGLIETIGNTIVKVIDGVVSGIERLANVGVGNLLILTPALIGLAGALMLFSVGAALAGAIMPSRETIEGIAQSVERFAAIDPTNLWEVGKGMAAVGAGVAVFGVGAAVGGNTMPGREVIEGMASSVERFGKIPSANLAAVGVGMSKIGEGLAVFGVGGALADLLNPGEEGLNKIAKNVEMFGQVPSENLAAVGDGMKSLGEGLEAFGIGGFVASLLNDPAGLVNVSDSIRKFGEIDASNFNLVGTGIEKIGDGLSSFGKGGFLSSLSEGFGKWIGASDPVEKFQKFAAIGTGLKDASDGIAGLSEAIKSFDDDSAENAADALGKFADSLDPTKMKKLKDSLAGLSIGAMGGDFEGGVYKLEPMQGSRQEGGPIKETGEYTLHAGEQVLDQQSMGLFLQGANVLSSMQTGKELTGLQKEENLLTEAGGTPIVVNAPTTTNVNQAGGTSVMLPPSPIQPQQSELNTQLS